MDDDEELRNQCFGGEYLGEMYDHVTKRMSYRKQKRWWNAYILMYERIDAPSDMRQRVKDLTKSMQDLTVTSQDPQTQQGVVKIPEVVEKLVRRENVNFMHAKMQYSVEYFQFMRKLLTCNQSLAQAQLNQDSRLVSSALSFSFYVFFALLKQSSRPCTCIISDSSSPRRCRRSAWSPFNFSHSSSSTSVSEQRKHLGLSLSIVTASSVSTY